MATHLQSNPLYYSPSLPSSTATRTVFLEKKGNQRSFGVYVGQDVPNGLYVVTVELGSPAADAQIQPGDRVVAVNDQYVSQMTGNPKRTLMDLAMHSQTLTLTIQSTNIFQQLNLPPPHHPSHGSTTIADITASLPYQPAVPARRPLRTRSPEVNVDLERYIKSLFGDENIQILPSSNFSSNSNEFVLTAGRTGGAPLINSHHHSARQSHSHRPHHRRHSKRVPLRTTETQTSVIDENHPSPPIRAIPPTQPSMGTSQVMLKTQKSAAEGSGAPDARDPVSANPSLESVSNARVTRPSPPSTTSTPVKKTSEEDNSPPQHMVDIVQAAMDATKRRDQDEKPVERPRQPARPPSPIAERPNAESGVYRVRQAEQNSSNPYAPTAPPTPAFPSTIRGENLRRIHLKRAGNFNGFGFHLQYNKIYYLVHRVENGSPSETGNLRPNDVIHSINDKLTEKMAHPDFVQIVNSNAELDLVVQNLDDFLRAYPQAARTATSSQGPSNAAR